MNPPATRAWCRCRSHDFVRENERSGYKSSRTLQPSQRRRGHAMKHVLLPLAAAALLLAACGREDDSVMSPDPAPPVEPTTPDDTMPKPMPRRATTPTTQRPPPHHFLRTQCYPRPSQTQPNPSNRHAPPT